MDNIYYLTHPRIGKTGVVYAPSTEKARTTFLDWLERHGHIRRSNRNFYRRDMIAERIEDPNVPTDVVLNYGYKDFSGRFEPGLPQVHDIPVQFERPEVHDIPVRLERPAVNSFPGVPEEVDDGVPSIEIGEVATDTRKRMPIQEVMLRGYSD